MGVKVGGWGVGWGVNCGVGARGVITVKLFFELKTTLYMRQSSLKEGMVFGQGFINVVRHVCIKG